MIRPIVQYAHRTVRDEARSVGDQIDLRPQVGPVPQ